MPGNGIKASVQFPASIVPRPCPAFCTNSDGKRWVGLGNEASFQLHSSPPLAVWKSRESLVNFLYTYISQRTRSNEHRHNSLDDLGRFPNFTKLFNLYDPLTAEWKKPGKRVSSEPKEQRSSMLSRRKQYSDEFILLTGKASLQRLVYSVPSWVKENNTTSKSV